MVMAHLLINRSVLLTTRLFCYRETTRTVLASSFVSKRDMSSSSNKINIENVVIIGSGLMGSGIAQVSAASGKFKSIVLQDVNQEQLNKAKDAIHTSLTRVQKKDPSINPDSIVNSITFSTTAQDKGVGEGLLVLEAVPEKLELKQDIFKSLYAKYGSNEKVILATNTSSLPCRDIGIHIPDKSRFAGLHFFNPVAVMKLVEIIRVDDGTNQGTYDALVQYVKDIKKVGITCKDTPGFIVNRLLIPYLYSAIEMIERGDATIEDVDIGMKLGAGYPMGPFELLDYTGLDTALFIADKFVNKDGSRIVNVSPKIKKLVEEGKLGRKSGQGFYSYEKK